MAGILPNPFTGLHPPDSESFTELCGPCHRGSHQQYRGLLVLCKKAAEEARGYEHLFKTFPNIPLGGNVEKEVFWGRPV